MSGRFVKVFWLVGWCTKGSSIRTPSRPSWRAHSRCPSRASDALQREWERLNRGRLLCPRDPHMMRTRFRSHQPIESHEFVMLNSNKRSVALDLKTDAGRQALLDLVETADVLIENFAPGTMERLQLGPARLQRPLLRAPVRTAGRRRHQGRATGR
jgi:hypothetical protein